MKEICWPPKPAVDSTQLKLLAARGEAALLTAPSLQTLSNDFQHFFFQEWLFWVGAGVVRSDKGAALFQVTL